MALTWKDAAATALLAVNGTVTYARLKGFHWPLLGSWRMGSLVLLVIGMASCIVASPADVSIKGAWMTVGAVFGSLAFVLAIAGLIFNSKLLFMALALNIALLWAVTTMHHIFAT